MVNFRKGKLIKRCGNKKYLLTGILHIIYFITTNYRLFSKIQPLSQFTEISFI